MYRKDPFALLGAAPRSVSSIAGEMRLKRRDVEDDRRYAIRSAEAQGARVAIVPPGAVIGCVFREDRLVKPGKCPACKGSF